MGSIFPLHWTGVCIAPAAESELSCATRRFRVREFSSLAAAKNPRMGYRTLADCIADLQSAGQLVRIEEEIDPYLEAAEIQRRVYAAQGPAIYYARVRGTQFPMVSNLFGTLERTALSSFATRLKR